MAEFIPTDGPMIFDVGANIGQTITDFRSFFPRSVIHSFEPSPTTFQALTRHAGGRKDVHLWNFAFGSTPGRMTLRENSFPVMSFLQLGDHGWGQVVRETPVEIKTVDQFCREQSIEKVDILKSDTQGFDLEVLLGAEQMIRDGRIGLVYLEVIFAALYENQPSISRIYDFMLDRDFYLVPPIASTTGNDGRPGPMLCLYTSRAAMMPWMRMGRWPTDHRVNPPAPGDRRRYHRCRGSQSRQSSYTRTQCVSGVVIGRAVNSPWPIKRAPVASPLFPPRDRAIAEAVARGAVSHSRLPRSHVSNFDLTEPCCHGLRLEEVGTL